mgnify:CR=1 FL=1
MADTFDILTSVKSALGITGTYQDGTLKVWITDIKDYLKRAGIDKKVIDSEASAGVIARGVADLWNYGSGNGQLSPYFAERVVQLALWSEVGDEDVQTGSKFQRADETIDPIVESSERR